MTQTKERFSMATLKYSREQLIQQAQISQADLSEINQCRQPYTRLGFAYQLAFVRLANRFPSQQPFEVDEPVRFSPKPSPSCKNSTFCNQQKTRYSGSSVSNENRPNNTFTSALAKRCPKIAGAI
jgi:hypothetical protein